MDLSELKPNWDQLAKTDPFWAIITWPDKIGNKWQVDEFLEDRAREVQGVMEYVLSLGINLPRRKALDFGCGVGRVTHALACYFDEVYAVDISPTMIDLARQLNRHGLKCKYYINEKDDLRLFNDDTFDFIYSTLTLQHMKPRYSRAYIKEFLRILVPNGLLVFQQPSERILSRNDIEAENQRATLTARIIRIMGGWGRLIKRVSPEILLKLYRELRRRSKKNIRKPRMEMYVITRQEVVKFLQDNGGKIVNIVQNQAAGPEFISYRYAVTKQ